MEWFPEFVSRRRDRMPPAEVFRRKPTVKRAFPLEPRLIELRNRDVELRTQRSSYVRTIAAFFPLGHRADCSAPIARALINRVTAIKPQIGGRKPYRAWKTFSPSTAVGQGKSGRRLLALLCARSGDFDFTIPPSGT